MDSFRLISVVVAGVVIFVGTVGISHAGMAAPMTDGHMAACPLMGVPALCHMSPLEHAFTLQNMFAAVPFSDLSVIFLSILLVLSAALFLAPYLWIRPRLLTEPLTGPPEQSYPYRHPLQEAFARGIIHSKAF